MPVETSVIPKHGLVVHRFTGVVRLTDIQQEMARTLENPDYHAGLNEIVDLREATDTEIDFLQLLGHTRQLQMLQGDTGVEKTFYLVAGTALAFGMARMFQNIADAPKSPLNVHVVAEMKAAQEGLGITGLPL